MRCLLVLLLALPAVPAGAQESPPPGGQGQAYFEFLQARRLEAEGDLQGALAALARAEALDPASADIFAERAALQARANDGVAARASAERALALDGANAEAHRILALIFAAWADNGGPPPPGESAEALRRSAIGHLRALRGTPAMATDLTLQMTYGRLLLRSGETDEAVSVLENVAAQAPYVAEPFVLLAEARTAQGRMFEAAEALAQAAQVNPRYYVSLGELYERLGRWAAAAGAYGQAVEGLRAPSRDLHLRYISALLNVPGGEGAGRARDALASLLQATPDDARLLGLQATALRQLRDFDGAEQAARRLLAVAPGNLAGLQTLARVLADQYRYQQVIDLLAPVLRTSDTPARGQERETAMALAELGLAQQQVAAFDDAVASFTAARRLAPAQPIFSLYLAQALLTSRQYDRALDVTGEAIRQAPEDARLIRLRARVLSRLGRASEAIAFLEEAIRSESRSPQLALALADAYAAERRYDEALRVVQQAEAAFGEDEEFVFRTVSLYEDAGRIEEAERRLRALIERDPLDAAALNHLGYLLADRTDRAAEALPLIQRALQVEPGNPAYLDSLGWALFKLGRVAEAEGPLSRAAAAWPASSVVQDHLGDVLARLGRRADAIRAWQRALAGDGESIDRAAIEQKIRNGRRRR